MSKPPFKVGDKVRCVDVASLITGLELRNLELGKVYTVSRVNPIVSSNHPEQWGLSFEELRGYIQNYRAYRFVKEYEEGWL